MFTLIVTHREEIAGVQSSRRRRCHAADSMHGVGNEWAAVGFIQVWSSKDLSLDFEIFRL